MKKIITSLMALSLMFSASAQTSSGDILLDAGTDFSFTTLNLNDIDPGGLGDISQKTSGIELNATGGYFVIDGLVLGLLASYSSDKTTADLGGGEVVTTTTSLVVGPMLRYYIGETNLWGQLSYGLGSGKTKDETGGTTTETDDPKIGAFGLGLGYAHFLNDNISINPSLSYSMVTATTEVSGSDDIKMKMGGISFGIAFNIHF
jgi:hypothetical protein